jgi:hypothetical protein
LISLHAKLLKSPFLDFFDSLAINSQNFEAEKQHSLLTIVHPSALNREAQIPVFYLVTNQILAPQKNLYFRLKNKDQINSRLVFIKPEVVAAAVTLHAPEPP